MNPNLTSTDISHILSTNVLPNAHEISALKYRTQSLEERISGMRAELDHLEHQLCQHRGALSPLRAVPLEVISQIIGHTGPWGRLDLSGRQQLVNLSLVCKAWRDAALLCRGLWNSVSIEVGLETRGLGFCENIASWLGRSGDLPKALEIRLGSNDICECGERWEDFDDVSDGGSGGKRIGIECRLMDSTVLSLLTTGSTLHHLSLASVEQSCFDRLLKALGRPKTGELSPLISSLPHPWSALRSLAVNFRTKARLAHWDDRFEDSLRYLPPQLASFYTSLPTNVMEDTSLCSFPVPLNILANLTSLSVTQNWEGSAFFQMLEPCTNLESLKVCLDGSDFFVDDDDPVMLRISSSPIILPKLRAMNLERLANARILNLIHAPVLQELKVDIHPPSGTLDSSQWDKTFTPTLDRFLKGSGCVQTIGLLHISGIFASPIQLSKIIVSLPNLDRLVLDYIPTNIDALVRRLAFDVQTAFQRGTPLLRCLKELEVLNAPSEFNPHRLIQFVTGLGPVKELKCTLSYYSEPQAIRRDAWTEEKQLRRAGRVLRGVTFRVLVSEHSTRSWPGFH